ncbi:MAG TPA: PAS domain-containing protein [Azospirillaceae bacterium]|nr:PAS domain-containing protein [Azospirillaceae bacterium]
MGLSEAVRDTPLRSCLDYWLSLPVPAGAQAPLKRSLDPVEMPRRMLPHLFIYERTPDGRFRCRLSGTAVVTLSGRDPTGRYLEELVLPRGLPSRLRLFEGVLAQRRPVLYRGHLMVRAAEWKPFQRLLLPLADEDMAVRFVFGMVDVPAARQPWERPRDPESADLIEEIWATDDELGRPLAV